MSKPLGSIMFNELDLEFWGDHFEDLIYEQSKSCQLNRHMDLLCIYDLGGLLNVNSLSFYDG